VNGRLNQDVATLEFASKEEDYNTTGDELRRVLREAGYPSGHRLIEWL
jgi:hypothetical protein